MCRLFLSIRNSNTKQKMYEFLKQSDHPRKNTPGINNYRDENIQRDGFGFAWFDQGWKLYKNPFIYHKDPNLDSKINKMKKEIVIGQLKNNRYAKNKLHHVNIHPFVYENNIIAQNGRIKDFKKHRDNLVKYIAADLVMHIMGETDTEFLLFMYLTILRRRKMSLQSIHDSMLELFRIFDKEGIELTANIIYANESYVLITRYIHYDRSHYKREQYPQSLYYFMDKDGKNLLVSSEPVSEKYEIFPMNTMMVLNFHNMKKIHSVIPMMNH